jgi:hypothetical protein
VLETHACCVEVAGVGQAHPRFGAFSELERVSLLEAIGDELGAPSVRHYGRLFELGESRVVALGG